MALILEGKSIRDSIRAALKEKIETFVRAGKSAPKLVILQVGNNPASSVFIKMKKEFGESIGAEVVHKIYPAGIDQKEMEHEIMELNSDAHVSGIILQLPIPESMDTFALIESIDPLKDVDALHSKNKANGFLPATTRGILTLLDHYEIKTEGKNVLVIGRSELVGIPTALAFIQRNATVTVAHSKTEDLKEHCLDSDIIVSVTGKADLITKDMVKEGQIIIDVGITNKEGKIAGDVSYDEVMLFVGAITPVPGGIGPLTVASIFQNLLDLYEESLL